MRSVSGIVPQLLSQSQCVELAARIRQWGPPLRRDPTRLMPGVAI
jgi:hypothetical protein